MSFVQKLVTADSFDARGVLVKKGHIGTFNTETLNGEEKHLQDVGDFQPAIVEMSAIAPTGPNPTMPQQVPPEAYQGAGGSYTIPGKVLVGEVTNPQEQRIDNAGLRDAGNEAQVDAALADVMDEGDPDRRLRDQTRAAGGRGSTTGNGDDALVEGTVADVTADLGTKTDDELSAIEAAENDREKPRTGVLNAIAAEREARTAS